MHSWFIAKMAGDVIRFYIVKEEFFPFVIEFERFVVLQSDIKAIKPGYWLCKISHNNKFKNVRKMKYQDLIKYPSGIKEGTEVSIDLVPADYDFNYLDLVHGGKVSETHSLLPNWSSKIAAGNEWPYSNMAGITFITVTGYHVAKPSWVAIEHLIFFLSKSISHWQSFQGLLSNWQFFTLKKMTNSMVL